MTKSTERFGRHVLRYRFERSGALAVQWLDLAKARSHLLRIGPGGQAGILAATTRGWESAELMAGRSPRHGMSLVTFRTARSEDAGIAVSSWARNKRGRSVESAGRLAWNDEDQWHRVDVRRSGLRITTERAGAHTSRAAVGADGRLLWRTAPAAGTSVMRSESSGGGSSGTTTKEIYVDGQGRAIGSSTTWDGPGGRALSRSSRWEA